MKEIPQSQDQPNKGRQCSKLVSLFVTEVYKLSYKFEIIVLILYGIDTILKLGDFGLSVSCTNISTKFQAVIAGTVSHLPPEAWAGTFKEATKSWDIYE